MLIIGERLAMFEIYSGSKNSRSIPEGPLSDGILWGFM